MSVSILSGLFTLFGGLGMFLYGMNIMSDGLQKAAGSSISKIINRVTENRLMAVLLGAGITALIQSSSATTVMLVGFVNAGIMNLSQAVGIIMGANIGTTITAWMVSLTQISSDAFAFLQPSFFAPLLVGIGAFRLLFGSRKSDDLAGAFCTGIGLIFIGLGFMSEAVAPYADSPVFSEAFKVLGANPVLGILAGAIVTGIIQSSAASVSILQTLSLAGAVPRAAGFYITLGQNIGTCITALLSSIGTSRTARRTAVIHLTFNVLGAIFFGVLIFIFSFIFPPFFEKNLTPVEISLFHTVFNVTCTVLLFPFADLLVDLSGRLVPEEKKIKLPEADGDDYTDVERTLIQHLDRRIMESPAIAISTAHQEIVNMGAITGANIAMASHAFLNLNPESVKSVLRHEKVINNFQDILTKYLIRVDNLTLSESQKLEVDTMFNTITDIERAGDHAENIAERAQYAIDNGLSFSNVGVSDFKRISQKVQESYNSSIEAFDLRRFEDVVKTARLEDEVDELEEEIRAEHIGRLSRRECDPAAGVVFLDVVSDMERISDHADNIAGYFRNDAEE